MNLLFNLLFFLTPLIFSSANSELFEVPKMHFVYLLTVGIVALHLFKYIRRQVPLVKTNKIFWSFTLFLVSQIVSTLFSIDPHTSLFGYYSRLNGGLLSLVSYYLIFCVATVYFDTKLKESIIKYSLLSGVLVAVYGIAQHFGIDANMWIQDVQSRVFSTLGQPNWLAAYLCILLPFALDRFLHAKTRSALLYHSSLIFIFYLCLLFTKSKSGIIAAVVSLSLYFGIYLFQKFKDKSLKPAFLPLSLIFLFLISSSLFLDNPVKDFVFPTKAVTASITNSTINITPSEDIRKIVWAGAFKLWRQFPLFGTGPETFAYSYYWVRPAAHNVTSEWDFLYNKAHNEYLNYLATTGSFGFASYLLFIFIVIFSIFKSESTQKWPLLASFVSILVTNAAGFSVVTVSLYFFILPAFLFSKPDSPVVPSTPRFWDYLIFIPAAYMALQVFFSFFADISYAKAATAENAQNYSLASNYINVSLTLVPGTPDYLIKSADIYSKIALTQKSSAAAAAAIKAMGQALTISPFNLNYWKERAQDYYYLSAIDSRYYIESLKSLDQATKLAPTDAKSFYMLGEFYDNVNETDYAVKNYQRALELKPNYDYAAFALGKIYFTEKKYPDAQKMFELVLKLAPTNTDAAGYLQKIEVSSKK